MLSQLTGTAPPQANGMMAPVAAGVPASQPGVIHGYGVPHHSYYAAPHMQSMHVPQQQPPHMVQMGHPQPHMYTPQNMPVQGHPHQSNRQLAYQGGGGQVQAHVPGGVGQQVISNRQQGGEQQRVSGGQQGVMNQQQAGGGQQRPTSQQQAGDGQQQQQGAREGQRMSFSPETITKLHGETCLLRGTSL